MRTFSFTGLRPPTVPARPLALALALALFLALGLMLPALAQVAEDDSFSQEEIIGELKGFFGKTTKGLAEVVQKVFADHGRPNAYIVGEEVSGAIGVGLRYGEGVLHRKPRVASKIFWQGPTVGFDIGGNASKTFTLIYNLKSVDQIYQRYPGVEGTLYFVAGVGVIYQQSGDVIMAPIRTGLGWRAGANIGYVHYGKKHSWLPF